MPKTKPETTIEAIREDRGWTGPTAARRAGIDPATLHRIENGSRRLLVSHLQGMLDGWRMSEAELQGLVNHYGARDALTRGSAAASA